MTEGVKLLHFTVLLMDCSNDNGNGMVWWVHVLGQARWAG